MRKKMTMMMMIPTAEAVVIRPAGNAIFCLIIIIPSKRQVLCLSHPQVVIPPTDFNVTLDPEDQRLSNNWNEHAISIRGKSIDC